MKLLVTVALGIGVVGTAAVNIAYYGVQRKHRKAEYCMAPLDLLLHQKKCVQLLGGMPIRVKKFNLKTSRFTENEAKFEIPVKGNTRNGVIYTMSTRENEESSWAMQYAVFCVRGNNRIWKIWLHPNVDDGDEIPEEIADVDFS